MAKRNKYDDIRSQLKTGDIILFSGTQGFSSVIKFFTRSPWSHIGIVCVLKKWDMVAVWESTTEAQFDMATRRVTTGVQLNPLSTRLRAFKGEMAVRQLQGVELTEEEIKTLIQLRKELKGRAYETNKFSLLQSAYDGVARIGAAQEDLSSLFCSELVAEAYQRLNLLDVSLPSAEYVPADFGEDRGLQLSRGTLGETIILEP